MIKGGGDAVHLKATVEASMKATSYMVTVSLSSMSGTVRDANCHCKASEMNKT